MSSFDGKVPSQNNLREMWTRTAQYVKQVTGDVDVTNDGNLQAQVNNCVKSGDVGKAGGVAGLDSTGKVPADQLPEIGADIESFPIVETVDDSDTVPLTTSDGNKRITVQDLATALEIQRMELYVHTCVGAKVTCSNGTSAVLEGTGSCKFNLPDTGVWTVRCTMQGITVQETVEISTNPRTDVYLMLLDHITVTRQQSKTIYDIGEQFDPTNIMVTATYMDDTTDDITPDCTYDQKALTGNDTSVTVSYTQAGITKTTDAEVFVRTLQSIAVAGAPSKTTYYSGEVFASAGTVIAATMTDGSTKTVAGWTYTPQSALSSKNNTITFSYTENGYSASVDYTVTVRYVTSIYVSTAPTKTAYNYGETFDSSGMGITAKYNDGTVRLVSGWTTSPTEPLKMTDTSITITYTEGESTQSCTQAITIKNVLTGISVTTPPTNTVYLNVETFDKTGMVVTASYKDGTKKTITGYTTSPTTALNDETAITISYTENGVTKTTTQAISVKTPSTTLENNDWETIRLVSDRGKAANYWKAGDTKSIIINGKVGNFTFSNLTVDAFILGVDHNSSKEGTNKIHWMIGKISSNAVALCDSKYNNECTSSGYFGMNTSQSNTGGWSSSYMRNTLLGNSGSPSNPTANTLLAALPSDLRAVMQTVTKYTDNVGKGTGSVQSNVTATTDYLFLLAEYEVFGSRNYANDYERSYQLQYDYFSAGNSRIAKKHSATSTAVWWWLRSPHYATGYGFCIVYGDGSGNNDPADWSAGVRPCFVT